MLAPILAWIRWRSARYACVCRDLRNESDIRQMSPRSTKRTPRRHPLGAMSYCQSHHGSGSSWANARARRAEHAEYSCDARAQTSADGLQARLAQLAPGSARSAATAPRPSGLGPIERQNSATAPVRVAVARRRFGEGSDDLPALVCEIARAGPRLPVGLGRWASGTLGRGAVRGEGRPARPHGRKRAQGCRLLTGCGLSFARRSSSQLASAPGGSSRGLIRKICTALGTGVGTPRSSSSSVLRAAQRALRYSRSAGAADLDARSSRRSSRPPRNGLGSRAVRACGAARLQGGWLSLRPLLGTSSSIPTDGFQLPCTQRPRRGSCDAMLALLPARSPRAVQADPFDSGGGGLVMIEKMISVVEWK